MGRWILAFAFAVSSTAAAQEPSFERVRAALSAYEGGPGPAFWHQLGPGALPVLVELYNDIDQPSFIRLRSIGAAAHYPSPATRTFLLAIAHAPGQPDLFVREAIDALSRAFGSAAVREVQKFADHPSALVREAVVRILASARTSSARRLLRRRRLEEKTEYLRIRIDRALRQTRK